MKLLATGLFASLSLALLVSATACTSDLAPETDPTASDDADIRSGKKKTCASVGGECVGLGPTSCQGGRWADANQISCGGGAGAGCCLPPCPAISAPPPGFCPGGTVQEKKNATGCTIGFECIDPPAPNECEASGGQCVGLGPSSCAGGRWGDASQFPCGSAVGVGCCLAPCPAISPPAPGFCPGGTVKERKNATGCTVGFDCIPAPNTCESRGGQCVGLAPGACPSGNYGDPSTHSCGGGVGVGCCLP